MKRKHTADAKRDLPALVGEIVEPLALQRESQYRKFELYRETAVTNDRADQSIMQMYRQGVINVQRIPEVLGQWEDPSHDWEEKCGWRLFNAATFSLTGKVAERPTATQQLHVIIDRVCSTSSA